MKYVFFFIVFAIAAFSYAQEGEWIKAEAVITEVTVHPGKRTRETAIVKFNLEDGTEQFGNVDLFRIPFLGSMKFAGDTIAIKYNRDKPALVETVFGNFLSSYGMYILIVLGIIYSIKPYVKWKKSQQIQT